MPAPASPASDRAPILLGEAAARAELPWNRSCQASMSSRVAPAPGDALQRLRRRQAPAPGSGARRYRLTLALAGRLRARLATSSD
jgi:hypothetical protein